MVDGAGRLLGSESFAAEETGYRRMVAWFELRGRLVRVGVEGTGSYGAGLARYLTAAGVEVVEVNRPNRQLRRQKGGETDSVDAEGAARAAASGEAVAVPKSGDGPVECLRMLLVARRSATKARTQAANQIYSVVVGAPEQVKHQLRGMKLKARVAVCARWRPGEAQTTTAYAKRALRHLARRYQSLEAEIAQLHTHIRRLCAQANPALPAANGVGPNTAAALLVAASDNPERMSTEASFAALCGASPVHASSEQTMRHRLNRGGNRAWGRQPSGPGPGWGWSGYRRPAHEPSGPCCRQAHQQPGWCYTVSAHSCPYLRVGVGSEASMNLGWDFRVPRDPLPYLAVPIVGQPDQRPGRGVGVACQTTDPRDR